MFDSVLLTLPRQTTSSGGKLPADVVLDLAADIMGKLPVNYDMEAVGSVQSVSRSLSRLSDQEGMVAVLGGGVADQPILPMCHCRSTYCLY